MDHPEAPQRQAVALAKPVFCRTKAGLLLYAGRTKPDVAPPPPPPELLALPDRSPEAA
jgi:hypothetical protein